MSYYISPVLICGWVYNIYKLAWLLGLSVKQFEIIACRIYLLSMVRVFYGVRQHVAYIWSTTVHSSWLTATSPQSTVPEILGPTLMPAWIWQRMSAASSARRSINCGVSVPSGSPSRLGRPCSLWIASSCRGSTTATAWWPDYLQAS